MPTQRDEPNEVFDHNQTRNPDTVIHYRNPRKLPWYPFDPAVEATMAEDIGRTASSEQSLSSRNRFVNGRDEEMGFSANLDFRVNPSEGKTV